jgi:protein SCO1/2
VSAVTGVRRGAAFAARAARLFALAAWLAQASFAEAQAPDGPAPRVDAARLMNELMTGRVAIGTPFSLPNQEGRRVGPAEWRGQIVLLYFGYTYCPDACPTDLRNIAVAIEELGAAGPKVQPVFITLDPQRDTPSVIGRYAQGFHPRFEALGGTEEEVRRVASAYKVYFEKVPLTAGSGYVIDHTSFTYVLDTEGRYVGYFPPGTSGRRIAEFVKSVLARPAG